VRNLVLTLAVAVCASPISVFAQSPDNTFADPAHFRAQKGAVLYRDICQGCHMPDARGATGAGEFPALAGNPTLAAVGYPLTVVLKGQKGMPGFAAFLDDAQVAAVVNYVRTHFGNTYNDEVSAADARALR
jgi:mono/diheme cytochrome c family protein